MPSHAVSAVFDWLLSDGLQRLICRAYSHDDCGVTAALQVTTKVDSGGAARGAGSNPASHQLNTLNAIVVILLALAE